MRTPEAHEAPRRPADPLDRAARRLVLRDAAADALGPVTRAQVLTLGAMVPLHALMLPPGLRGPLMASAAGSAAGGLAIAWLIRARPGLRAARPHALLTLVGLLVLLPSAHHLLLSGQIHQITNLQILLLALGGLTLRWSAFIALSVSVWAAVLAAALASPADPLVGHFVVGTALAQAVAITLSLHRRSTLWRTAAAEHASQRGRAQAEALAAALADQRAALSCTVLERDALFAAMTHELRSPIQGVLGVASLLGGDAGALPDAERRRAVAALRASGDMMLHVVNQVLEHSRLDRGGGAPTEGVVALPELLDEVFLVLSDRAEARGDTLTWGHVGGAAPLIRADRAWLRQVLLNLVGNAVKFTEGGVVRVSLDVKVENALCEVIFVVQDNGPGFDPAATERIFAPYQQAGPEISARFGGTGLGLAISRRIARALGGDVVGWSSPGEGARFTFSLKAPLVGPAPQPLEGTALSVVGVGPVADDLRGRLRALGARLAGPTDCSAHLLLRSDPRGAPMSLFALGHMGAQALRLPVEQADLAALAPAAPAAADAPDHDHAPTAGPRLRVLLVDDDVVCLTVNQMGLAALGHSVRVATDPQGALSIVDLCASQGEPIDALVVDVHLGAHSGLDLARSAKRRTWGPGFVIALTGDTAARADAAGVAAVCLKPTTPTQLHRRLLAEHARAELLRCPTRAALAS